MIACLPTFTGPTPSFDRSGSPICARRHPLKHPFQFPCAAASHLTTEILFPVDSVAIESVV